MAKTILDACCGSRMFWFDKHDKDALFIDNRVFSEKLQSGHKVNVAPDIKCDFRNMPFEDNSFSLVVFDPPHLLRAGKNSWLAKKYGVLNKQTWREDLSKGFEECWRVLKFNGVLIFKWNTQQIPMNDVLKLFSQKPKLGDKRSKTRWLVFMKVGELDG